MELEDTKVAKDSKRRESLRLFMKIRHRNSGLKSSKNGNGVERDRRAYRRGKYDSLLGFRQSHEKQMMQNMIMRKGNLYRLELGWIEAKLEGAMQEKYISISTYISFIISTIDLYI